MHSLSRQRIEERDYYNYTSEQKTSELESSGVTVEAVIACRRREEPRCYAVEHQFCPFREHQVLYSDFADDCWCELVFLLTEALKCVIGTSTAQCRLVPELILQRLPNALGN